MKYIDLHTHCKNSQPDVTAIFNIRAGFTQDAPPDGQPLSYGIHPWDADNADLVKLSDDVRSIKNLYAIGECGMDKKTDVDLNIQRSVFLGHAILAKELNKPLIIHCVGAYNEIIDLKHKIDPSNPWFIHGFTGHSQLALQLIKENILLSFGESILKEGHKSGNALSLLPPGSFFLETDESERSIRDIYQQAARLRNEKDDNLIELLNNQFIDLFE